MRCKNCNEVLLETSKFCPSCGEVVSSNQASHNNLIGFSDKINDPKVSASLQKINKSGMILTFVLAIVAVVGFTMAGLFEVGGFELPFAFYLGLGLGGLLILLSLYQRVKINKDKWWDGVIEDKVYKAPSLADQKSGDARSQYTLHIRRDDGKIKKISTTDDLYNYYNIGDKVRHHANTLAHLFEKYDKSLDTVIYCVVCSTKNNIEDDNCRRCKSPLLK